MAYYTYSNVVKQQQDFVAATCPQASISLDKLKEKEGRTGGVPVNQGPMAADRRSMGVLPIPAI